MDYTRHVEYGLAYKAWRRQRRERDRNERGHNFAHIAGKSDYAAAGVTVTDGNDGGMTVDMTGDGGTLTPDLTL